MTTGPLSVGTRLKNRYVITRLVAGGGMAWVYEVQEQRPDGSRVIWALKELRADIDDPQELAEARQLFTQEANILVRLSHPNLPRVSAYFIEDGRSYLVMEFIRGDSLKKILDEANAPLMESEVLYWAIQICDVLDYLHHRPQPVIFRDMKPSNVMVMPTGQVKLIDFGIARTYKQGKSKDTVTMGSENYAAPEQWGQAQTDARADIYGLGATLYHLLTNVPPLPAFVPSERVAINQYNGAVSTETIAVVEKAMADDREHRFATARAMQEALLECLPRRERREILARLEAQRQAPTPAVVARPATKRPAQKQPAPMSQAPASQSIAQPTPSTREAPAGRTCPRCRTTNRDTARFCRGCGYPFVPPIPPVLALIEPETARWEYPVRDGAVLIGRRGGQERVDLDVGYYDPEGYVSRNHARITSHQRRYYVIDLHSANGTYVNDRRLAPNRPYPIRHGDRIRLGRLVFLFRVR
jgi:hypothetical protein